jgi:predicted dienelactone hydrolase
MMKGRFISKFRIVGKLHGCKHPFTQTGSASLFSRLFLSMITVFWLLIGGAVLSEEWNVGLRMVDFADPIIQDEIHVTVWYPTKANAKDELVGMAILQVAKNADLAPATKGLILISHGFSGNFLGHEDTARYLATNGYIVATITHPDIPGLHSGIPELDPLISRPRQITLIIDGISNHPLFKASLLSKKVGFVGFSLGAYSGLIAAGAKPDLSSLEEYCGTEPKDFLLCSVAARQRFISIEPQLLSLSVTKISGAVLLAPAYGPLFSKTSFANISIPMRLISAGKDQELDNRFNAQHLKNLLSERATHSVIADAGHFIFMAPCSDHLKQTVPVICEDLTSVDRVKTHRWLNKDIALFFDRLSP